MPFITLSVLGPLTGDPAQGDVVHVAPAFGLQANGTAYFDPNGAAAGEHAALVIDSAGRLKLTTLKPTALYALEGRPVELAGHVTGPVTEKVRVRFIPPAARIPKIRRGRPIGQLPAVAALIREKPGVQIIPPHSQPPVIRDGQPVGQRPPETLPTRLGRPVSIAAAVTAPIRRKTGPAPLQLRAIVAPSAKPGLPVSQRAVKDTPRQVGPITTGRPIAVGEHVTLDIRQRTAPTPAEHPTCPGCGTRVASGGRCAACREQALLQHVATHLANGRTADEIATRLDVTPTVARHLIAKHRRSRRAR